jgi:hypothetical protein
MGRILAQDPTAFKPVAEALVSDPTCGDDVRVGEWRSKPLPIYCSPAGKV